MLLYMYGYSSSRRRSEGVAKNVPEFLARVPDTLLPHSSPKDVARGGEKKLTV